MNNQLSRHETRKPTENCNFQEGESNKASVYLRIRSKIEAPYAIDNNVFKVLKSGNLSKNFTFERIFEHDAIQAEVYSHCVEPSMRNKGNLTVLAYGASNSGKTFTLIGDRKQPGIIPQSIEEIFSRYRNVISAAPTLKLFKGEWSILDDEGVEMELKNRELYFNRLSVSRSTVSSTQKNEIDDHGFASIVYIWISFAEIYNENVIDLLEPEQTKWNEKRRNLTVVSNRGNAYISGLTSILVTNSDEALHLLQMGINARQNGSTSINKQSSRSHCIFIVDVIQQDQANGTANQTTYKFCDLAGAERLKKSEVQGARCVEAKHINKSMFLLGRCLESIYKKKRMKTKAIVPFRDSKLTTILQSSLNGLEKLSFIVNMLPTAEFREENEQVLRYASMAQEIVYEKPVKEIPSRRSTFSKFLAKKSSDPQMLLILNENERLKQKIGLLETDIIERNDVEQKQHEMIQQLEETILELKLERDHIRDDIRKVTPDQCEVNSCGPSDDEEDAIYTDSPFLHNVEAILESRFCRGQTEYLVNWSPSWVWKKDVTKELIILQSRIRERKKECLIKWSPSWVPKKDVTKDLIQKFEEGRS